MKGPSAGDVHAVYEVWASVGLEVGCVGLLSAYSWDAEAGSDTGLPVMFVSRCPQVVQLPPCLVWKAVD